MRDDPIRPVTTARDGPVATILSNTGTETINQAFSKLTGITDMNVRGGRP